MKLQEWLASKQLSVNRFAKHHGLCKESLYSYLKGRVPQSNVAVKIVKATGEAVTLEDLGLPQELIEKVRLKRQKLKEKMEKDKARRAAAKAGNLISENAQRLIASES